MAFVQETLPVSVGGRGFKDLLSGYRRVYWAIIANRFRFEESGRAREVPLSVVDPRRVVSTEGMLAELKRQALGAGALIHLLALGAAYPERKWDRPILAIGSDWRHPSNYRAYPRLVSHGGRILDVAWDMRDWEEYLFLATPLAPGMAA
jgi:hypothetical protein